VKNARCEEFLRRSDSSSWFLGLRQSEWERQLFSVLAVLGRVGLRGTRRTLLTNYWTRSGIANVFVALGEGGRGYRHASHPRNRNNGEQRITHDIISPGRNSKLLPKLYHMISAILPNNLEALDGMKAILFGGPSNRVCLWHKLAL
jgi:hypothetical protein